MTLSACSNPATSLKVDPPRFDPQQVAKQAIELYDADGDQRLSADELKACPGIARNLRLFDTDSDDHVSDAEIAARVNRWREGGAGLLYLRAVVAFNGIPLPEAEVHFEPEPFLADVLSAASGVSGPDGAVALQPEELPIPEPLQGRPVLPPGLYKVRITHPKMEIPARYNTHSELGCEVSQETANPSTQLVFQLKGKRKRS